jgi:hypothetical protein
MGKNRLGDKGTLESKMTAKERKHYETMRDIFAILFIVYYMFGGWFGTNQKSIPLDIFLFLGSFVINGIVCYFWIQFKSRSAWFWSLFILGVIGWIVLAVIKDETVVSDATTVVNPSDLPKE